MTEAERQHTLREAAVDHLFDLMSDTSEHHWCAGWMDGTEIALWKAVKQYPEPLKWGMFPVDLDTVRKLRDLALAVDGWWVWGDDGQMFIPLAEWERMYDNYLRMVEGS